jgi:hypothetical protein
MMALLLIGDHGFVLPENLNCLPCLLPCAAPASCKQDEPICIYSWTAIMIDRWIDGGEVVYYRIACHRKSIHVQCLLGLELMR